jgi:hypothetical protein
MLSDVLGSRGEEVTDYSNLALLKRKYGGTCISLDIFRRDYLPGLKMSSLLRFISTGRITLRVVKSDWGGTAQRIVYLHDIADWLDSLQVLHGAPVIEFGNHSSG